MRRKKFQFGCVPCGREREREMMTFVCASTRILIVETNGPSMDAFVESETLRFSE